MDLPTNSLIHRLIESAANESPENVAVEFGDNILTYKQLNERADRIATSLLEFGVKPDDIVGVYLERSIEMVVVLLGIFKAGAAYVPLDPNYPQDRTEFMIEDSCMVCLITQNSLVDSLPETGVEKFIANELYSDSAEIATPIQTATGPSNLAYVIYTSGSTGKPKGVSIEHRSVVALIHWALGVFSKEELSGVLFSTSICFDLSAFELFVTLSSGGKVIVAQNAMELPQLSGRDEVTLVNTVPSAMNELVSIMGIPSSVKVVNLAGEALSPSLVDQIYAKSNVRKVYDLYGPSEDTTYSTFALRKPNSPATIGKPITNTRAYVLDPNLKPVPVGETGELYLTGEGLARGYLNRPELTEERFIPSPLPEEKGNRLYKTGDLCRFNQDGNLEYLGRLDHQIKIRGFRIELGEIESALCEQQGISNALVQAREDTPGVKRLAAYLISPTEKPDIGQLRKKLLEKLPDYMVPSSFTCLESFPLNSNGKIDRSKLPAPNNKRPELQQPFVAPRTKLDKWLVELWERELGLTGIGLDDPFFELGGDSLMAGRIVAELQAKLGEPVFVVVIFERPTIAKLGELLRDRYRSAIVRCLGPAEVGEDTELVPLSQLDESRLESAKNKLPKLNPRRKARAGRNRSMWFILAPPRSGTTLLTAMLAGHPKLQAAAELNLMGFNSLAERRETYTGKKSLWREGLLRLVMDLHGWTLEEAEEKIGQYEKEDWETCRFYGLLQDWVDPRLLVEKSPAYALDPELLARIEEDFIDPVYLHLSRHPLAMIQSFAKNHMDQVYFDQEGFSAAEAGEAVWTLSHENVTTFLRGIPSSRHYHIRFEDLVRSPEDTMRTLCSRLNWEFDEEMVNPYKNKAQKIPDGIRPESKGFGDPKFHAFTTINANRAEVPQGADCPVALCERTKGVASELGYELSQPSEEANRPVSNRQQQSSQRARSARSSMQERRARLQKLRRK